MTTELPLSILDRSTVPVGGSPATVLSDTVRLAAAAEQWGYHRFWVSEHHSVPGIAGAAPTVLAAAVGQATSRIRVGTGGVMLPNHRPLVVAEQFGTLESLYPGRIDMGLGRSVGFTGAVRAALGRDKEAAEDFETQLAELLGFIRGDQERYPGVHARPGEGLDIPAFLLATGAGAAVAARLGLPLVIGAVRGEEAMSEVIADYRRDFHGGRGYVIVSASVAVAPETEEARRILLPEAWSTVLSRTKGEFAPLWSPADVEAATMTDRQRRYLDDALRGAIWGTASQVRAQLAALAARTDADEILITTGTHDRAALHESYRLLMSALCRREVHSGEFRRDRPQASSGFQLI